MAFFTKKTWEDRRAEFINRRTLTKEDGTEEIVTVARNEGTVSAEGDAFNAETMNNLEGRVEAGFNAVNESLNNYVKIVPVKLYAKTTFAPVTSTDVYFAIPNVNGYKCLLGIGGISENGFILPNRPSNTPKNGTIILSYTNKDTVAQTVEDLYCNMIFIRNH